MAISTTNIDAAIDSAVSAAKAAGVNVCAVPAASLLSLDAGVTSESVETGIMSDGSFIVTGILSIGSYATRRIVTSYDSSPWPVDIEGDAFGMLKASAQMVLFARVSNSLYAIFNNLPDAVVAFFSPVEKAMFNAAEAGDWNKAASILSGMSALIPSAMASQLSEMISALAPYVSASASLSAATSALQIAAVELPQ